MESHMIHQVTNWEKSYVFRTFSEIKGLKTQKKKWLIRWSVKNWDYLRYSLHNFCRTFLPGSADLSELPKCVKQIFVVEAAVMFAKTFEGTSHVASVR